MYKTILGIDSWTLFVGIGVISALLLFRYFSYIYKLNDRAFLIYGILVVLSIAFGFLSAILFQAFYDYLDSGKFAIGGLTFMGGLVGGVGFFVIGAIIAMNIYKKDKLKEQLWSMMCIAPISVTSAHFFGRIGCFLAGCCYGKKTECFLGIDLHIFGDLTGTNRFPTQLYEAIFLLLLCIALIILVLKFKKYSLTAVVYLFSYSIFRFSLEFLRGDYRGGAGFLSPSQWQSVFMFILGAILAVYMFVFKRIPFNKKQYNLSGFLFEYKEKE